MNQRQADWPDTEGWPSCPNPDQLQGAIAKARNVTANREVQIPPQHDEDLDRGLELTAGNDLFANHTRANYLLHQSRIRPGTGSQEENELLALHASAGDTTITLGLGIIAGDGQTTFSRLLRDNGWTGACKALPLANGLQATIHESRTHPGRPGAVTLTPEPHPQAEENIPRGELTTIAFICRWHGAESCRWLARPGRTPEQPAAQGRIV